MAARARKTDIASVQGAQVPGGKVQGPRVDETRPGPTPASSQDDAAPSPARLLQQALYTDLGEPEVKKWPPIATLGFILGTCGAFWALVAFGVSQAVK